MTGPDIDNSAPGEILAWLSRWIDDSPANLVRDPEALTWLRLAKIGEEFGEVIEAYIGVLGANPRKGITHDMDAVRKELLDMAVTALCAYEHLAPRDDVGCSFDDLEEHVRALGRRAKESSTPDSTATPDPIPSYDVGPSYLGAQECTCELVDISTPIGPAYMRGNYNGCPVHTPKDWQDRVEAAKRYARES
jgi:hypothetical protein